MNTLEELSKSNRYNYLIYLSRMTTSLNHSTKGKIPELVKDSKNILDVGCGSGVLLETIEEINKEAKLTGVDLNIDAINSIKGHDNWTLYHSDFMDLENVKFDAIIFSSILHEISSYYNDSSKRFTEVPILEAFNKSYELLSDNGIIVVRDGLLPSPEVINNKYILSFKDTSDYKWLYKFQNDFRGFDKLDVDTSIKEVGSNKFLVSSGFLKEFLCTYTWGEDSYPREINERYGILTKEEWLSLIKQAKLDRKSVV